MILNEFFNLPQVFEKDMTEAESQSTDMTVAQQVFKDNPDIDHEDDILNAAFPYVVKLVGSRKRANYMFNYDEDFPSDLIGAYRYLQRDQHDVGLEEGTGQDSKSWMASIRQQHPDVKFIQAKMLGAPIIALVNGKPVAQFDTKKDVEEGTEETPFGSVSHNDTPVKPQQYHYGTEPSDKEIRKQRLLNVRQRKQDLLRDYAQMGALRVELIHGINNDVFLTKDQLLDYFDHLVDDPELTPLEYAHENGIPTDGLLKGMLRRAAQLGVSALDVRKLFASAKAKQGVAEGEGNLSKALDTLSGSWSGWHQVKSRNPDIEKFEWDDGEGGFYAGGSIEHNLKTGEVTVDYHGEYDDEVKGTFKNMGDAMRALRGGGGSHGGRAPNFDRLGQRTPPGPDDLRKTDRTGRKGTIGGGYANQLKGSIQANKGRLGPKGVLPEQGMAEAKNDYVPPKEANYDDKYQAMVRRVGEKARAQEKARQQQPKAPVRESRLALLRQIIQS